MNNIDAINSAEEIFNKHSWAELHAISPSKSFCLKAMEEYAAQFQAEKPIGNIEGISFFEAHKRTFAGHPNAGEHISKADFLKYAAQTPQKQSADRNKIVFANPEDDIETLEWKQKQSAGVWIDVKDKLPEIRVPVLVYMTYGKIDTCYWTGELWLQSVRIQHSNGDVAHWMPLPTPPNETPKQLSNEDIEELVKEERKGGYVHVNSFIKGYKAALNQCG